MRSLRNVETANGRNELQQLVDRGMFLDATGTPPIHHHHTRVSQFTQRTPCQPKRHPYYQFHVRAAAVKTGGFHCNRSASITRLPFSRSFSFCRSLCAIAASVNTMTWFLL